MTPPQLNLSKAAKRKRDIPEDATAIHRKASAFAGTKAEAVEKHFSTWVAKDPQRYERLLDIYNRTFNSVVAPQYDGSAREIAGISSRFVPYPYQLNAVERMLNEPGVLLNHVVGAGKTGSMLMGAMELKRLGVAQQPWMVVPNHLLDQVGIEAKQWFPGANILVESREGSDRKGNRQTLLAQSAANDWDLVLVSMSSFSQMSMSADFLKQYRDQEVANFTRDIEELAESEQDSHTRKTNVRRLEQKRDNFENSINAKIDKVSRDDTITWDKTRGDYLIVDEAHNYKNLRRVSKLADLAEDGSDRATDLDVKLRYLRSQKGDHAPIVTFATGTPIANSIAEIYTMLSYLRPDILQEAGMYGVNSWAHNFTSKRTEIGFTAGNTIKPQTRISSYENLSELSQMCSPMADTITRDQIPRKIPTLRDGETTVIEFDVDPETRDLIQDLAWREDHQPENSRIDNALNIMNDGQKATLSPELAHLPPTKGVGRVHAVIQNVFTEWEANRENEYLDQRGDPSPNRGGLQIIFCDKGVPKPNGAFSIYESIREGLVNKGMDKDRIRFIHDWDNNRTQLFDDCNNGKVDVLIANTAKLGTGANIQARGVAIHHVDVPWRPADIEQQDGRFFRQGNQNDEVARYTYIGRGTYDGHSWATQERKGKFINQFWNADRSMRSMEPLEDGDLEAMAQNKAIATGNPDFVRKAELTRNVEKLEAAAEEHVALAASNVYARGQAHKTIEQLQTRLERTHGLAESAEAWSDLPREQRTWNMGTGTQTDREDATGAMVQKLAQVFQSRTRTYQDIGSIAGIPFTARYSAMDDGVEISSPFGRATRTEVPKWVIDPSYAHSGISPKEIKTRQTGLLTQLENTARSTPETIGMMRSEIETAQQTIREIDEAGTSSDFPQQHELDKARAELTAVNKRLEAFDTSAAEVKRKDEYRQRLASKGRSPGYSLELNPTNYMRENHIICHPESRPIKTMPTPAQEKADNAKHSGRHQCDMSLLEALGFDEDTPLFMMNVEQHERPTNNTEENHQEEDHRGEEDTM
ncbi:DEAD/DEAH box helicase family protein [Ancrocorticia populi]|uniref:DEAD/DEAH box helicase family protein n=1 Tax=Ancrocorticia populi TaxID=2175228 RepID=UPI003F968C4E